MRPDLAIPGASQAVWSRTYDELPATGGAYVLWIDLAEATPLPPRFKDTLAPGQFLYVGSAYGPGGIRARCKRHLAGQKSLHWHIDWLTSVAQDLWVLPLPGQLECDLLSHLVSQGTYDTPVPGFGSSDCKTCASHLLRIHS